LPSGRTRTNCRRLDSVEPPPERSALDVADIEETTAGLRVTIRQSKTDQDGEGATIAIARGTIACPVQTLREWLDAAGIESGALFRSVNKASRVASRRLTDRSVANIVKAMAGKISKTTGVPVEQLDAINQVDGCPYPPRAAEDREVGGNTCDDV
jgi:hypothetical protein